MERKEIEDRLMANLKQFEIPETDSYKNSLKEQLINIETYFSECEEKINSTMELFNSMNLTVRGICKNAQISKSTIYNSPDILKKYIVNRVDEISKNDILSKDKVQNLQHQVIELQNLLDKTIIDTIKFNNSEIKNDELESEIASLTRKVELLSEERNKFIMQINSMDMELRNYRNTRKILRM